MLPFQDNTQNVYSAVVCHPDLPLQHPKAKRHDVRRAASQCYRQGDAATVRTLLSAPGALSFINYQDADGLTPIPTYLLV
jgi:hypothetical protein